MDKNKQSQNASHMPGFRISTKIILTLLSFVTVTALIMSVVYHYYTQNIIMKQINLRTYSITHSLSNAVLEPLLEKNYLRINKITTSFSELPSIAYIVIINKNKQAISSMLGDETRFSEEFIQQVEQQGFPVEKISQQSLNNVLPQLQQNLILGGQAIHEVTLEIGNIGAEAHVGLFTADIKKSTQEILIPLMSIFIIILILGGISAWLVGRSITKPLCLLAVEAEKISKGKIGYFLQHKTTGEIWQLSHAFHRMQISVNKLLQLMHKKQG